MALTLDASTPALVTSANDPWTSASFTPPNNSLLVVKIMADWFTSGTPLIAVTSSGLTFERIGRIGAASQGLAEIWIARVGSNGGTARTVSATTTITDDTGGIKVEVWTGFNADDPIDAFVCQANNTTNSISPACVTTTDNAWLTGGGVDWQNLGAATSSDTNEHGEPGGVAILAVRKSAATSPAGSPTLNFDASGAGTPLWTWAIAALRADTAAASPIYKVADRGSTQNLTAQTSTAVDMAAAGSIAVGNYLIARLALDNSRTDTAGAAVGLTVTDPRSNTWTVTAAGNADPGAANAGSTCYIAYAKVANAYTNGDDITFNYTGTGNSVPAKAIIIEEWFGINKTTPLAVAATTTSGATATGSLARTPTAAGQLVYGALSYEGVAADQITSDTDQTDGSWLLTNQLSTTSGTATSNQTTVGIYKRVTGTSAQTWNVQLPASRDWGAVMLVFDAEPAGGSVSGVASATFGFTGTASGVPRTSGAAAATFGFTATAAGIDRALGAAITAFGFTATAAGIDRALGAAAATFGFTATSSGVAGTPPVTGHADGLFGFTGTASGVPRTRGAAAASLGFTGSAVGVDRALGQAAAAFGFTATAAGRPRAVGLAIASLGFTATAAGRPRVRGAAIAAFGFTGSAQGFAGHPPVTGQATGLFGFTGSAAGQPRALGAGVAAFGFTSTASGRRRVRGVTVTVLGFTGAVSGRVRVLAIASAPLGFTGLVDGVGTPPYVPLTSPVASVRLNVATVSTDPNPATASAAPNRSAATIRPNPAETT